VLTPGLAHHLMVLTMRRAFGNPGAQDPRAGGSAIAREEPGTDRAGGARP
jgi:hypothetical protein